MALIVQKYGGSSVASVERIQAVAQRVARSAAAGDRVVAVVSAMGKTTDELIALADRVSASPDRREMDMLLSTGEQVSIALLSMALQALDQPAISLTGAQVGIVTETQHNRARILNIQTERLWRHLAQGKVVVVAGFQGIAGQGELEITTLGRGGSDTSAVATATALGADRCEIYTDVPGILTADPSLVPQAQIVSAITCDEMLELASLGAKVLHPRAVEIARNYGVPLVVRSAWNDAPGTRVLSPVPKPRSTDNLEVGKAVDAVELERDRAKLSLMRVPDSPGIAARLFGEIAHQEVDVDLIAQSVYEGNTNDIAFTVRRASLGVAEAVAEAIAPALGDPTAAASHPPEVALEREVAEIAISGAGMIGRPGIAATMFSALNDAGVNIQIVSTSEVKVSCIIALPAAPESPSSEALLDRVIAGLCRTFEIGSSPVHLPAGDREAAAPAVRGVALDTDRARLAVRHVPDRPGTAARIFNHLAQERVQIDTIVQSQRSRLHRGQPTRDIAFTVPSADAEAAQAALQALAPGLDCGEVLLDTAISKVSAVGSGMLEQPGVAARMFAALAERGINIQTIATSEIKISCVVAQAHGPAALEAVHTAFGLAQHQAPVPA